jgi:hypothetical protein
LEEGGEAPAVERSRKGHVVKRGSQRTVLVMFDDGEALVVPAPYAAPVGAEVGMAVRLVEFVEHEDALLMWGPQHFPTRPTETPGQ